VKITKSIRTTLETLTAREAAGTETLWGTGQRGIYVVALVKLRNAGMIEKVPGQDPELESWQTCYRLTDTGRAALAR
jgi:hypothetical protein